MNGAPELPAPEAPPAETALPLVIAQPEAAPVVVEAPTPAVPVAASAPAPSGDTVSISPRTRHAFSIPAAAACIGALAVLLYALSPSGKDADVPATAAPAPVIAARTGSEAIAATAEPRPVRTEGLLSTEEAASVVEEFRSAYEARNVDRLVELFAPDAAENGTRGVDAIAQSYRRMFTAIDELSYTLESLAIAPRGPAAEVRGPFIIRYREMGGDRHEVRGQAEWEVRRREGRPLITALTYRLDPQS